MLDGELQERPEVSGREDDGTSEVRDVQLAVPETGNGCGQTEGRGRARVRQQRQDVPFVVSHVHGRVRHRRCDRNQVVGPVRRLSGRNCGGYVGVDFVWSGRKRLAKSRFPGVNGKKPSRNSIRKRAEVAEIANIGIFSKPIVTGSGERKHDETVFKLWYRVPNTGI